MSETDAKIRKALDDLDEAHKNAEQFYAATVRDPNKDQRPNNIVSMALAFDKEGRAMVNYKLALVEKHPDQFSAQEVSHLESEKNRLDRRIRSWNKGQFPSLIRE